MGEGSSEAHWRGRPSNGAVQRTAGPPRAGLLHELIQTAITMPGPLGLFLRKCFLPSGAAGVAVDPRLPSEMRTPFLCRSPHSRGGSKNVKSRRGLKRRSLVKQCLVMESMYAMSWLALGSPVHVQAAGPRRREVFIRATTAAALRLFFEDLMYVCRHEATVQFTCGRAGLAEELCNSSPTEPHGYASDTLTLLLVAPMLGPCLLRMEDVEVS